MGKSERSNAEAKATNVRCWQATNRSRSASTLGEGAGREEEIDDLVSRLGEMIEVSRLIRLPFLDTRTSLCAPELG